MRNVRQITPRDDRLVIAEFAGKFIKNSRQIDEAMNLYLSSDKEILCPFRNGKCIKIRGRPTGKPLPLCTIRLKNGSYLSVCHERIANKIVITNLIKELGLKVESVLGNVKLPSGRSYDFLVVAREANKSVDDKLRLIFLEVITVDTINTGSLLRLLQFQNEMRKRHNMSINWENVRKREVVQMLYKDIVVRKAVGEGTSRFNNIDVCYVGIIQKDTYYKLFGNNVTKSFNDFCSNYINYDKSIGFLLFTMVEHGDKLTVKLDSKNVEIVDLEKLIGAYPGVVKRDANGLLRQLQNLI